MTRAIERLLDDVGWRILAALQADARLPFSELGRRVGLSAPAVAERVRRLQDAGIIRGFRAELGLARLGLPIEALIRVSAREDDCPALKAAARALPEVLECLHVTGSDAFVLRVAVSSVGHLETIIERVGRHGTPTTSVILSAPVAGRILDHVPVAPATAARREGTRTRR
jgi:Lrp/AsnC family transcriptional regulator, leucine-responsive regulatory protein